MNFNHVLVGDEQTATTHEVSRLAGWLGGRGWCQVCGVVGVGGGPGGITHSSASFARCPLVRSAYCISRDRRHNVRFLCCLIS